MIVGKYIVYTTQHKQNTEQVELWVGVRPTHLDRLRQMNEDLHPQGDKITKTDVMALGTFFYNEITHQMRVKALMCRGENGQEIPQDQDRACFFEQRYKPLVIKAWQNEIKHDTQADLFKKADISAYLLKSAARY